MLATAPPPTAIWRDPERAYRVVRGRDRRFDGVVFHGVRTTGIFCRPSCPARTPARAHVEFFPTAAAAVSAGFRACRRCRPDAVPGSPDWDVRGDTVARAMRHLADGVVDREGVEGLARRVGYGRRHLHRLMVDELGAGPLALARLHRAELARTLLVTGDLPITEVAWAAGFASLRQFQATVRDVFDATPSELRRSGRGRGTVVNGDGAIEVFLPARPPFDGAASCAFLAARTVPGLEAAEVGRSGRPHVWRALSLPHGHGIVHVTPASGDRRTGLVARLRLEDLRDLQPAVRRVRRWFDLDADPVAVDEVLLGEPALAPLVRRSPGRRVPGTVDPFESAVRTVIGQQVSVAGARTVTAALVQRHGARLRLSHHGLTHVFPTPSALAAIDPEAPPAETGLSMPRRRAATVVRLARAVVDGRLELDLGADRDRAASVLGSLAGVGPWTVAHVRMQALGDPDVFLDGDLGIRRVLERRGPFDPASVRPWRSYAVHHLWSADPGSPS